MKKTIKIILFVIVLLVIIVLLAPIIFKGPIEKAIKKSVNNNLEATVSWEDFNLSIYKHFPDATVSIKDFLILSKGAYTGDTLAYGESVGLNMDLGELFKGEGEPISIKEILINNTVLNLKTDTLGNTNFDVAKKDESKKETEKALVFDVQNYEIENAEINYIDDKTKTYFHLENFNHSGTGDLSASTTKLTTKTDADVSFTLDSINYLNKHKLQLDAIFDLDLENQKYTFSENKAIINQLPLTFEGFVKVNENNNEIDLSFKTPSSDFKNFLAIIPEVYSKNISNVETTGDFTVNGIIKGIVSETTVPQMDIQVSSSNASFKYPDLPKKVENIAIDLNLKNETGLSKDTYLNINNLNFKVDTDEFNTKGSLKNLTENMLVDLAVKGRLNLANIEKTYPVELENDLNGIIDADFTTQFDYESIEKEQYQNIKGDGTATISNFRYTSEDFKNPIDVSKASLAFNPQTIQLKEMKAQTGKTDAAISGTIQNLFGYLFADQKLKGQFKLNSNQFAFSDFMTSEEERTNKSASSKTKTTSAEEEAIKIPAFLDAQVDFTANQVLYDNLVLKNVTGNMTIKDEIASLNNVKTNIFGGSIGLTGNVSTQQKTPTFAMNLDLSQINIVDSFKQLELLQSLAPLAKAFTGNLNTNLTLKGNLNEDFTPVLSSLVGDALAKILDAKIDTEQTPMLQKLDGRLDFINLDNVNLKDITTQLSFSDGKVNVAPLNFNIKDFNFQIQGSHGFDNQMNYNLNLDVPAKYLGSEISGGLASLTNTNLENTKVKVPISLTGNFANPSVNVNTEQAVRELSQKIIDAQKDKATDKVKEEINDKLNDILNPNKENQTDTIPANDNKSTEDKVKEAAGNILKDLFGNKKN
ncbi:AsmA-like C-terminal region-containing protein [Mesonia sp. K7]|uniref:AsmA-like C-terminal region-containing protein n=1 Tax=Mesonia sp. K7 TaxID=2218606 RepID=UPI000DAA964B|nr:AsmA-like C-terminal region-containing protein [Mesonia sp. K7]PZD78656.1 AsmA family protein [Mesonia sp. K7]